jgi:TPR repeat protein
MEKLGIIYYVGEEGVEEDEEESQKWYTMAAEAGSKDAREKLGYLF